MNRALALSPVNPFDKLAQLKTQGAQRTLLDQTQFAANQSAGLAEFDNAQGIDPSLRKTQVAETLQLIAPPQHLALTQASNQRPLGGNAAESQATLSATERELIHGLARALTNIEIAWLRERSAHTGRNQLSALFSKLGASNRTEALGRADGLL